MPGRRLSDAFILSTAGVVMMLLAAAAAMMSPAPAIGEQRGSSYSAGAEGAKGAFLALRRLGYQIDRSFEPITALAAKPFSTTLVLASPSGEPSEQDRKALVRFLERGGVVLATGAGGAKFFGALAADASGRRPGAAPEPYFRTIPSPLSSAAPQIRMAREVERVNFDDRYLAIYGTDRDAVVRSAHIGRGRAIWWAGSTPLANNAVALPGHLELLLNAAGEPGQRAVLWDERYHGHVRSLWSYAVRTPLPWMGLQLTLVAAALLATFSRRRSPLRPRVMDPRTSPMEFVDTMGGLYEQAHAGSAAVAAARSRLRRLLLASSGLPPDSSDAALARASGARVGLDPNRVAALLASSSGDAHQPREWLPLVLGLQRMSAMITRFRGSAAPSRRIRRSI